MIYENIEYTEVFIDPSAAEAGDGTSASSPLTDLPATLVSNTAYIIRRTSEDYDAYVQQQAENDSLTNIAFIGMPKSTDPQWIQNLVSDKTWLNDTANYANIRFLIWAEYESGYKGTATISSKNLHFTGINCFMYKDKFRVRPNSDHYQYNQAMFYNNNATDTNDNSSFKFYGCKFGVKGLNIDDDTWLAQHNITDLDDTSIFDVPSKRCKGFLYGNYISEVSFENCIVNNISCTSDYGVTWQTSTAFALSRVRTLKVENCTFNAIGHTGESAYDSIFYIEMFSNEYKSYYFNNIVHNIIFRSSSSIKNLLFFNDGSTSSYSGNHRSRFNFTNVTCNLKAVKDLTKLDTLSNTAAYHYYLIDHNFYRSYIDSDGYRFAYTNIDNVNLNAKTSTIKLISCGVIKMRINGGGTSFPCKSNISNINIQFTDDIDEAFVKTSYNPCIVQIDGSRCFDYNGGWSSVNYIGIAPQSQMDVKNIKIDSKADGYLLLRGVVADLDTLDTELYVNGRTAIQINSMTTKFTYKSIIHMANSQNFVRVKNITTSPDFNQVIVNMDSDTYNNCLYIDTCDQEEVFDTTLTTQGESYWYNWQLTCANAGDTGKFITRNKSNIAQAWSIVRSGSDAVASLRMSSPQTANSILLKVCNMQEGGFEVPVGTIGNQDLKIYFAYTSFATADEVNGRKSFYVEVDIPWRDSNNKLHYITKSFYNTPWYEDNSTWSDQGAIARYMKLNLTTTTLDSLIVRPYYCWYSPTGVVYMDPDMHLIPAV